MKHRIPEGRIGVAQVVHYEVSRDDERMALLRFERIPVGSYTKLRVHGELVMSDTPMELRTNQPFLSRANGRVLIAGLGLGMIVTEVIERPCVESILVVEKHQDVVDLVLPSIAHPKLSVVVADILEWRPSRGELYDTIYFDIWPGICSENLSDIRKLHRAFSRYRNRENPRSWIGSWSQRELQTMGRGRTHHFL